MKKIYPLSLIILSLSACSKQTEELDPITLNYESGVVISKSEFMGNRYATDTDGSVSDCEEGKGVGVVVKSSTDDSSYIFNKNQQPCTKAKIVFDGTKSLYARAADPSVNIMFNDQFGKISNLNNIEKVAKTTTVLSDSANDYSINDDLATKQYNQMGKLKEDYVVLKNDNKANKKQLAFESIITDSIDAEKEEALALNRSLTRELAKVDTEKLVKANEDLMVQKSLTDNHNQQMLANLTARTERLSKLEKEMAALKLTKEIEANNYEEKLELLEKRVEDYAQLSLLLKRENERLAKTGAESNEFIATDLVKAEDDADNSRYAAMMSMAENIEVDEKLARALEISQKKALERKAQRLQTQADAVAYHANADKVFNKDMDKVYQDLQHNMQPAFEGKVARVVGVDINKEATLNDVQLLLNEKDKSVSEILNEILSDVQPALGTWKLDWKLASHNLQIKDEKWNVSAESTLPDFFEYIKSRVKEIHGLDLSIDYFEETRKIVITDNF